MTLAQYKAEFRRKHPNLRVNGWDERDYQLWGQLQQLPSYGLVAGDRGNRMLALKDVVALLEGNAETRFEAEWTKRFARSNAAGDNAPMEVEGTNAD